MTGNDLNKSMLLRISERYGRRAIVFRANVFVARARRGAVRSLPNGTADLLGCIDGFPVAIETKSTRDYLRESQRDFRTAWELAGGLYLVARDVDAAMEELARRIPL